MVRLCPLRFYSITPIALIAAMFVIPAVTDAQAQTTGFAEAGGTIARMWCSSCHLVNGEKTIMDTAPPFRLIANRPTTTEAGLKGFISYPHPPMPDFQLSRRDIADIVTYIMSLKSR